MSARILTNDEYIALATSVNAPAAHVKQVHRLLCDGHKVEDLIPAEQRIAAAFDGMRMATISNDYGWEPGIEEDEPEPEPEPEPKPKNGKKKQHEQH